MRLYLVSWRLVSDILYNRNISMESCGNATLLVSCSSASNFWSMLCQSWQCDSKMSAGGAFGGARGLQPRPPEKGVFPLDHFGECQEVKHSIVQIGVLSLKWTLLGQECGLKWWWAAWENTQGYRKLRHRLVLFSQQWDHAMSSDGRLVRRVWSV